MTKVFKQIKESKMPRRATEFSAGYDVFAHSSITIPPQESAIIELPFGINFDVEKFKVQLYLRSSMGIKNHLRLEQDEQIVPFIEVLSFELGTNDTMVVQLFNSSDSAFTFEKNTHFSQFIVTDKADTYRKFEVENVADLKGETPVSLSIAETKKGVLWVLEEPLLIEPNGKMLVPTGYKVKIDHDTYLEGMVPQGESRFYFANGHTIIDADYYTADGHCFVMLVNPSSKPLELQKGTPIVELISIPYYTIEDEIIPTVTRVGGIGSTTDK